ncbi:MAG: type IV pilin [Candidatus Methanomethyliaceae archaeon]|nr:type IV pilin [Candidatus Methanomethyliaceae archaeon]MDW7970604.1 archaellin/type IV pilin N-terminal domain-containing protein [Nitrososphaerota archaeon]
MVYREGVSPIIATILIIAITVMGAVVSYTFVMGFVGTRVQTNIQGLLSYDAFNIESLGEGNKINIYIRNVGGKELILDELYVDEENYVSIEGLYDISLQLYEISSELFQIAQDVGGDIGDQIKERAEKTEKMGSVIQDRNIFTIISHNVPESLYEISINLTNIAINYNKPGVSDVLIYRANQISNIANVIHSMLTKGWTFLDEDGNIIEDRSLSVGQVRLLTIFSYKPSSKSQLIKIVCNDGTKLTFSVRK